MIGAEGIRRVQTEAHGTALQPSVLLPVRKERDFNKRSDLREFYFEVRRQTQDLCRPLQTEDYVVQPIEDVSPPKWHLGHTTWFFETVVLAHYQSDFRPYHERYGYVFNSYYESFGIRVPRLKRGTLSRPTVQEIYAYRSAIDEQISRLLEAIPEEQWQGFVRLVVMGLNHEQQHQELLVTDIKCIYASSPLEPVYSSATPEPTSVIDPSGPASTSEIFLEFEGGMAELGYRGNSFAWDNEKPVHQIFLNPFRLCSGLVTNAEYLEFMKAGGYTDFRFWLSDGWDLVNQEGWRAPMYWEEVDGTWRMMTLNGRREVDPAEPVCHVSFYEADAFSRWAQKRLSTEAEWEYAAKMAGADPSRGNFLEHGHFHPQPDRYMSGHSTQKIHQIFGDVWEWTSSPYHGYPGYRQEAGALGEYNGKFMNNQRVLRGGSCATPRNHIRVTYRNFFQGHKRWQFTGIRLAESLAL